MIITLQEICNWIIICGSVLVAIKHIAEMFGKPIRFFRTKQDKEFDTKVVGIMRRELPQLLKEHHDIIKQGVLDSIQKELAQVETLAVQYEALVISSKDVIREKIMGIYHKNKTDHTLTQHEHEALEQYYKDYKAMNGNSYIDKYYTRMSKWRILEDDYEDV